MHICVQGAQSAEALRLVLGVVDLMTVLVDWINITLVMDDGGLLLQLLIQMLSFTGDITVQLAAVECLLAVTGRKVCTNHSAVGSRRVSACCRR